MKNPPASTLAASAIVHCAPSTRAIICPSGDNPRIVGVSALFVSPRSIYKRLLGARACWDYKRDACSYAGALPVVAHPPCAPYSRCLRHLCAPRTLALSHCAPVAIDIVRRVGGILEHPAYSRLWDNSDLPFPGGLPDKWGGITVEIDQHRFGHWAEKKTWLYFCGCRPLPFPPPSSAPRRHVSFGRGEKSSIAGKRDYTPQAFAIWLLAAAASASPPDSPLA